MAADKEQSVTGSASPLKDLLRCPFCSGPFDWRGIEDSTGNTESGILYCDCSWFPVVAGIPVLRRDKISEQVKSLLEGGRYDDALLTLIQPGIGLPPMWRFASFLPLGNYLRRLAREHRSQHWKNRFAMLLHRIAHGERIPLRKLLDEYYLEKDHNYYVLRFGQPRYLVALSFVNILPRSEKPILDLCCGHGHITRSLAQQAINQRVIGVDQSFWGLYVAKRWIAPEAYYVCCSADHALPFPDGTFSAVFCSDAFHYIVNKRSCVRECLRITQDDMIVLTWVHNKQIRIPHDGVPLSSTGYHSLFQDVPHRIVADEDVLDGYFRQQGPDLSMQPEVTVLDQKPLLSIVASTHKEIFRVHEPFAEPPHAKGRLGINPIYRIEETGEKQTIQLRRTFPTRFYEEDHSQYKQYMPENVELDAAILDDLAEGRLTSTVKQLIDQCVVLGMPEQIDCNPNVPVGADA